VLLKPSLAESLASVYTPTDAAGVDERDRIARPQHSLVASRYAAPTRGPR